VRWAPTLKDPPKICYDCSFDDLRRKKEREMSPEQLERLRRVELEEELLFADILKYLDTHKMKIRPDCKYPEHHLHDVEVAMVSDDQYKVIIKPCPHRKRSVKAGPKVIQCNAKKLFKLLNYDFHADFLKKYIHSEQLRPV
jgi:hypothetical protein